MNSKWMLTGGVIAVAAGVAYFATRPDTNKDASRVQPASASVTGTSPTSAVKPKVEEAPPWANSSAGGMRDQSVSNTTALPTPEMGVPKANAKSMNPAELQKMQSELLTAVQSGNPDPKRLKEILLHLKQTQGNNVGGVNVDVLIGNLDASQQLQTIAAEVQKEAQKPGGPDQRKMQELTDKMKRVQGQMRTDVMIASPTSPVQASK
ncbi:hypothetical protein [Undibacterium fentianense]|uniref:Uncharacterized protein n=1 Tax=Undibacterium fentianense TaxID=2828728 RepID=A0A941IFZ2_9BURK|nr:hypothetical protein [Undibacterium fentianense]MBR7800852.1 hypothetical protein [Undibacterium fentianense]